MKKILLYIARFMITQYFLFIAVNVYAQSAHEIIQRVDSNQEFNSQKFAMQMTIEKGSQKLVKTLAGYGKNRGEYSFMEFTNTEDRGVKYLKIKDELWIYFPDADDIMKISGHMLRQGMMGSDISYEDMMRREELDKTYEVKLTGSEKVHGVDCFVIEMNAKIKDALYARQIIYVDKNTYVPLKIEMYAKGDRMLKTMEEFNIVKSGNRYYAKKIVIKDLRKKNSSTTVEIQELQFNINVPDSVFTRRSLRK
ncbi:MAG: outer membrane lipoprotein-sorting protein [Spirochaetia bacterium]|nr:outer membrane lipoprotein-sorting protein [Spirochaetia bacterium]